MNSGAIIDEVHFTKDWSLHLKGLYDDFPKHAIWFSDSSSLVLRGGIGADKLYRSGFWE